jgi:pimeloyl-ACP methyl ester carboxylesterase
MNEALNLLNCVEVIRNAISLCKTKLITIIGASLGGYILMNALGKNPDLCHKAVILMCGQYVGINRSLKASFGLWAMNKSFKLVS